MHLNILAFGVPLFVAFMLLEYYYSRKKGKQYFHFDEAIANINVGIAERLTDLFAAGLFYFIFRWIYEHFALFTIPENAWTWLLLFVFTDFIWYWYHRFGHEVNLLWATHVVHHQSEDYNFTVSVRITVLQAVFRCLFWSFIPAIGFPPHMIAVMLLIHGIYPFFTHTQVIGRLGVLEYFLVTPSHHRVHHSSNPEYLDKNYGDVLIIWDKLFGTFAKETVTPVYGLTTPLKSYSFLWQHFHFFLEMGVAFRRAKGWNARWKIIFGKPDEIDPRIRGFLEKKLLSKHTDLQPTRALYRYVSAQTIFTLTALFFLLLLEQYQQPFQLVAGALFLVVSIINTGAMLEQKQWIFDLEYIRFALAGIYIYSFHPTLLAGFVLLIVMGIALTGYRTMSTRYYGLLYERST